MGSNFPARQIPAVAARWQQPRVCSVSRRFASSSSVQTQNPAYPLYPSVSQLLHAKGIPESEVSKIPASGPKSRLLKGDVLAYIGTIPADYPSTQASQLEKLAHLDLSNIKIASPPQPAETKAPAPETVAAPPPTTSVALSVSLATVLSAQKKIKDGLGITVPLTTFLARATDLANEDLPRSSAEKWTASELFDEVLGAAPVTVSRGDYVPEFNAVEIPAAPKQSKPVSEDIIDFLSGKAPKKPASRVAPTPEVPAGSAANVFSLTVPIVEEKRARAFLERIDTLLTIEPGRLVL